MANTLSTLDACKVDLFASEDELREKYPLAFASGLGIFQWIGDAAEEMAYMYSLIFNMLLLLGIIKGADQVTHRIFGM